MLKNVTIPTSPTSNPLKRKHVKKISRKAVKLHSSKKLSRKPSENVTDHWRRFAMDRVLRNVELCMSHHVPPGNRKIIFIVII